MRPSPEVQIRWGLGTAALALAVLVALAFAPDPLFRQRVYVTSFDDVEQLVPGAPVYFQGAVVGAVRNFTLDPQTRIFRVRLGVERAWRPS